MDLVIVESPAKAKKIAGILGSGFTVKASLGHIRDLPVSPTSSRFGVDLTTWEPEYENNKDKASTIKDLKALAVKAETIYLATDPDREGEAISWHLREILGARKKYLRATWNEITPKAVKAGISGARDLDLQLVHAQEARRIVDRLVGYGVSPWLARALSRKGLSAGRVQSVAARLVVERDRAIEAHVAKPYGGATLLADHANGQVTAELYKVGSDLIVSPEKAGTPGTRVLTEAETQALALPAKGDLVSLASIETRPERKGPQGALSTSDLQQLASRRMGLSPEETMKVAQDLFDHGAISYHRTDSSNLSDEAVKMAQEVITRTYGAEYVAPKVRKFPEKKGAQGAHEAIRPTHDNPSPAEVLTLGERHRKLYELIWQRFLACQMADHLFDATLADLAFHDLVFRAKGSVTTFLGWRAAFNQVQEEEEADDQKEGEGRLPTMTKGDPLVTLESRQNFKKTKPPTAFDEAGLVKELENRRIGRPSTYASIFAVIKKRAFVTLEKKGKRTVLRSTPLGREVVDALVGHFPKEMDYEFTARIEDSFDHIETGRLPKPQFLNEFWEGFAPSLGEDPSRRTTSQPREAAPQGGGEASSLRKEGPFPCPKCASTMLVKTWEGRPYVQCSTAPACKVSYDSNWEGEPAQAPCRFCSGLVRKTKNGSLVCVACDKWQDPKPSSAPASEAGEHTARPADARCPQCGGQMKTLWTKRQKWAFRCDLCDRWSDPPMAGGGTGRASAQASRTSRPARREGSRHGAGARR